jgi:hypothetical protein
MVRKLDVSSLHFESLVQFFRLHLTPMACVMLQTVTLRIIFRLEFEVEMVERNGIIALAVKPCI